MKGSDLAHLVVNFKEAPDSTLIFYKEQ